MTDRMWREGFAELARRNLSVDAWAYHPQLAEVGDLAGAFPGTSIILDHVGGPLGQKSMAELARRPNISVKVGGLGMTMEWFDFYKRPSPRSSQVLADAFRPWAETCMELFGAERSMFESNFPVDKITSGYGVLRNAFKRVAAGATAEERSPFLRAPPSALLDRLTQGLTPRTTACNSVV